MVRLLSALLVLAAARGTQPGMTVFEAAYLHSLSTNFGPLPLSGVGLSYDPFHKELYVTGDGPVRVFNESGMEVYSFGDTPELGLIWSIGALDDGSLIAFSMKNGRLGLLRCDFRGEFLGDIVPRNIPASLGAFAPSAMRYQGGKIYLLDGGGMRVLVLDVTGEYVTSYDVAEKLEVAEKRAQLGIRGFAVDRDGNMLFTIQPLFSAYLMTPAGEIRAFGQRGSAPGKFNVVSGIARDEAGYFYVADILKSAVIVFDPEYRYVKEFGYRQRGIAGMAAPGEIVVADEKLFVSNRGRKGVSVYRVGVR
jgi:hypothetical protein